jgi:hypothetical protein
MTPTEHDDHQNQPPESGEARVIRPAHGGQLKPFTRGDPVAAAGRAKGAAAQREARLLRASKVRDVRELLSDLVDGLPRRQLGPTAAAVAQEVMARVAIGEIKIRHGGDAADLIRVLVDVARVEAGNPNSVNVVAHMSAEETLERIRILRERAAGTS